MNQQFSNISNGILLFAIVLMAIGFAIEITPTANGIGYALCCVGALYGFAGVVCAVKELAENGVFI